MPDSQSYQRRSPVAVYLCLIAIAYLGWQLHTEKKRTTAEPPAFLPTFESRIEPIREEGTNWEAGYYFLVGKRDPQMPQVPQAQKVGWNPPQPRAARRPAVHEDPITRSLRQQNAEFERRERDISNQVW